jgi:hypothetical protein
MDALGPIDFVQHLGAFFGIDVGVFELVRIGRLDAPQHHGEMRELEHIAREGLGELINRLLGACGVCRFGRHGYEAPEFEAVTRRTLLDDIVRLASRGDGGTASLRPADAQCLLTRARSRRQAG